MQKLRINLRHTRNDSYDIVIGSGLLANAGGLIKEFCHENRAVIISDPIVAELYLSPLQDSLQAAGIDNDAIVCQGGEMAKTMEEYQELAEELLARRVTRNTLLVALGGGVCGDLCGFLAATVLRSLPFVQIPTSLLAQVDSAVGGKVGINTKHGKNLLGAFYQPKTVLCDTDLLKTLPLRQLKAGYAEILKYALINDGDFFEWLEENGDAILDPHHDEFEQSVIYAVQMSCHKKAQIVENDERESGQRALLNLGHTFAHALEACRAYDDELLHGEAVALGLDCAAYLSKEMKLLPADEYKRIKTHLDKRQLANWPKAYGKLSPQDIIDRMATDKKIADGKLNFILMSEIGKSFISSDVGSDKLKKTLKHFLDKIH